MRANGFKCLIVKILASDATNVIKQVTLRGNAPTPTMGGSPKTKTSVNGQISLTGLGKSTKNQFKRWKNLIPGINRGSFQVPTIQLQSIDQLAPPKTVVIGPKTLHGSLLVNHEQIEDRTSLEEQSEFVFCLTVDPTFCSQLCFSLGLDRPLFLAMVLGCVFHVHLLMEVSATAKSTQVACDRVTTCLKYNLFEVLLEFNENTKKIKK
ncbi:hypothetical protein KI387_014418, partial [Taxus chinensis]